MRWLTDRAVVPVANGADARATTTVLERDLFDRVTATRVIERADRSEITFRGAFASITENIGRVDGTVMTVRESAESPTSLTEPIARRLEV